MSKSKTYECILVEFVNESESYGVGFIEWLLDEELRQDTAKSEHAISSKSETSIKWPVSCDPLTAKKKADCEFKKHVVVVYEFGEWTHMYEKMDSMIKFGDPNPKKADRKLHAKRNKSSCDKRQQKPTQDEKIGKAGPTDTKVSSKEFTKQQQAKQKVLLAEYLQLKTVDKVIDNAPVEIDSKFSDEENEPPTSEKYKRNHSPDNAKQPKVTQAGKRKKAGPPAIKVSSNESAKRGQTKQKVLLAEYLQLKADAPLEIDSESSDEENEPPTSEKYKRNHSPDNAKQPKVTQAGKRKKAGPPAIKVISNKSAKRQQTKPNFLLRGDLELGAEGSLEINSESSDEDNRNLTKQELINKLRMMKYDKKKLKQRLHESGSIINSDLPAFKQMSSEILTNLHTALKISTSLAEKVDPSTDETKNVEETAEAVIKPMIGVSDCRVFTPSPQVKKDVKTPDLEKLQKNFNTDRQKSFELIKKEQNGQGESERSNQELGMEILEGNNRANNESPVEQTYLDYDLEVDEKEPRNDADAFHGKQHGPKAGVLEHAEDKNVSDKKQQSEPDRDQQKEQHYDGEDNSQNDNKLDNEEETVKLGPGVRLEKTRLLACNHENFRTLSNSIVGALFSMEELATSSLTGSAANFDKTKAAKKKLDPQRLSACLAYVKTKFPEFENPEETFKILARRKCNNAATNRKVFIK